MVHQRPHICTRPRRDMAPLRDHAPEPFSPYEERDLAHATAPSLHGPWTKQRYALSADEAWGETQLWAPHVIEHEGQFWMFVCGGGRAHTEYRIHLATSPDCWVWQRHPHNPLVVDGFDAPTRWCSPWMIVGSCTTQRRLSHTEVTSSSPRSINGPRRLVEPSNRLCRSANRIPGRADRVPLLSRHRQGWYYLFIGPEWEGVEKVQYSPRPRIEEHASSRAWTPSRSMYRARSA